MREETNLMNSKLTEQINIVDQFRDKYQSSITDNRNKSNNAQDHNEN